MVARPYPGRGPERALATFPACVSLRAGPETRLTRRGPWERRPFDDPVALGAGHPELEFRALDQLLRVLAREHDGAQGALPGIVARVPERIACVPERLDSLELAHPLGRGVARVIAPPECQATVQERGDRQPGRVAYGTGGVREAVRNPPQHEHVRRDLLVIEAEPVDLGQVADGRRVAVEVGDLVGHADQWPSPERNEAQAAATAARCLEDVARVAVLLGL